MSPLRGSCLCGAVSFEVNGDIRSTDACHCKMCRKWSGHFFASADVGRGSLKLEGERHLAWYPSSARARRGFCRHCGSSLLFDPLDREHHDWIGIALGAFDESTGTHLQKHIFVAGKGDYYDIADGLPQHP